MIHLNDLFKINHPLIELLLPEMYRCTSIKDFKDSASQMKPTKRILPVGAFYNGKTFVYLPSALFRFSEDVQGVGLLADFVDSLEITLRRQDSFRFGLSREGFSNLRDGVKLHKPYALYNPRDGELVLLGYEPQGPPAPERSRESSFGIQKGFGLT